MDWPLAQLSGAGQRTTEAPRLTTLGAFVGHRLCMRVICLNVLQFSDRASAETDYTSKGPRDEGQRGP